MKKFLSLDRAAATATPTLEPVHSPIDQTTLRAPSAEDGYAIHELVSECPPLDLNSRYCYLLQCTDFADTCILAEYDKQIVGWVSGYSRPGEPNVLFIWQVAVHPDTRGQSLAKHLLRALLCRPNCQDVEIIQTSVTAGNRASLSVFESLAESLGTPLTQQEWLHRDRHFHGCHDSERLLTIGPFDVSENLSHRFGRVTQ